MPSELPIINTSLARKACLIKGRTEANAIRRRIAKAKRAHAAHKPFESKLQRIVARIAFLESGGSPFSRDWVA